jgi:hypothetical protein
MASCLDPTHAKSGLWRQYQESSTASINQAVLHFADAMQGILCRNLSLSSDLPFPSLVNRQCAILVTLTVRQLQSVQIYMTLISSCKRRLGQIHAIWLVRPCNERTYRQEKQTQNQKFLLSVYTGFVPSTQPFLLTFSRSLGTPLIRI